jgi:hypothetical protein
MTAMRIFIPLSQNLTTPLGVDVRLYSFIREVLGLNLGLTTFTLAELFCGLSQSLHASVGIVARCDHNHFLLNPLAFAIHASIGRSRSGLAKLLKARTQFVHILRRNPSACPWLF